MAEASAELPSGHMSTATTQGRPARTCRSAAVRSQGPVCDEEVVPYPLLIPDHAAGDWPPQQSKWLCPVVQFGGAICSCNISLRPAWHLSERRCAVQAPLAAHPPGHQTALRAAAKHIALQQSTTFKLDAGCPMRLLLHHQAICTMSVRRNHGEVKAQELAHHMSVAMCHIQGLQGKPSLFEGG